MKGIFWNNMGLGDLAKHRYLSEMVKGEQINIIVLFETCKDEFSYKTLKNLCGGREFIWHSKAPEGRSGGILLGVDLDVFDIGAIDEGDFYVKLMVRDKSDEFKFTLYGVYGPTQQNRKEVFLSELAHICSKESLPFVIGAILI
jgi:hypothetical protein